MTLRTPINPIFFEWAVKRSNKNPRELNKKFKKLSEWKKGRVKPTFKQLENFAKATHVPFGYFFMDQPPVEKIPIPDLRTVKNIEITDPSPDLLEIIHLCQQRQDWYLEFLNSTGAKELDFVGSATTRESVEKVAEKMRTTLDFNLEEKKQSLTWRDSLRLFIEKSENIGVMVMISGIVGSNTKRRLDINEFRGFALNDRFSPLVFINGADSKSAQMFTLAHELAHIWLGKSALSNTDLVTDPSNNIEIWCNKVAAELLVPLKSIQKNKIAKKPLESIPELTRNYKVSSLVIIRRLFDAHYINQDEFQKAYAREMNKINNISKNKGGNFYNNMGSSIGKQFMIDLIASTLEGRTPFTESLRLLGIKKIDAFNKLGKKLGVITE